MSRIREILDYLYKNSNIHKEELVKGLGIEIKEIEDDITNLIKDGYISKKPYIKGNESRGSTSRTKLQISPKGYQLLTSIKSAKESESEETKIIPQEKKKIFLSHSYLDRKIADRIINHLIIPTFNIEKKDIFYTSSRETGIEISINWRNKIKGHIKDCDIFIALITPNFQESEMCQNELGAAWVLDKSIYPLILSPITYSNFSDLISDLQALELSRSENIKSFLLSLGNNLLVKYSIGATRNKNPEVQIKKFSKSLRQYLLNNQGIFKAAKIDLPLKTKNTNASPVKKSIVARSKVEWPDDFEMQEYYVQNQLNAMKQIENLPHEYKNKKLIEIIITKAKDQWPDDYEMQLYTARQQIEAYQRMK